jgi:oxygen-independent coproporphyrinogen-3 oxidase
MKSNKSKIKATDAAGLYVHIPFCLKKCPYCDFYSTTDLSLRQSFLRALLQEISLIRPCQSLQFDSVYIGGGTPSVLKANHIAQIIGTVHKSLKILSDSEITVEVNPGTIAPGVFWNYRRAGINRVNIGVQSFQEANLKFLGRIHSAKDSLATIEQAREAEFQNLGLDLIYGIPGQTEWTWRQDLEKAVTLEPEHLSCYMLTYESGTSMDKSRQNGHFKPMSDRQMGDLFQITVEFLEAHGYAQYEISNFARSKSSRSRHNQKYWSFVSYFGLGPSAHSFVEPIRFWNHPSITRYIKDLDENRLPVSSKETLSREQMMIEAVYLGFRKSEGLDTDGFERKFGIRFYEIFGKAIKTFEERGLLELTQNRCALTRKGMLFLDSIVSSFISTGGAV